MSSENPWVRAAETGSAAEEEQSEQEEAAAESGEEQESETAEDTSFVDLAESNSADLEVRLKEQKAEDREAADAVLQRLQENAGAAEPAASEAAAQEASETEVAQDSGPIEKPIPQTLEEQAERMRREDEALDQRVAARESKQEQMNAASREQLTQQVEKSIADKEKKLGKSSRRLGERLGRPIKGNKFERFNTWGKIEKAWEGAKTAAGRTFAAGSALSVLPLFGALQQGENAHVALASGSFEQYNNAMQMATHLGETMYAGEVTAVAVAVAVLGIGKVRQVMRRGALDRKRSAA